MNFASIKVTFTERPEVASGKTGKSYCRPKAVMVSKDYNGNYSECEVRGLVAFGEVAERMVGVELGKEYVLTCELGGKRGMGEYADRVFMEWVIRGVAEVVGRPGQQQAPARTAPREEPASDGTDDLPFGWLIGLATLGAGLGPMLA